MQSIIKKVGQNTLFGIPLASSESLPENWVWFSPMLTKTFFIFGIQKTIAPLGKFEGRKSNRQNRENNYASQDEDNDEPIYSTFDAQTQQNTSGEPTLG